MKFFWKMFITFLSIFFAINISNVYADETGPVVVQAIVQENYTQEITVLLVKPDTEEVVKTLKINKNNNWVQETNIPLGEYKMRVYGEGLVSRSITQLKATYMVKKVIKNPSVREKPCFVVIEGDKKFISTYYGLVDFQRKDGSYLKGNYTNDELDKLYQEAIGTQTGMFGSNKEHKSTTEKESTENTTSKETELKESNENIEEVDKTDGRDYSSKMLSNEMQLIIFIVSIVLLSAVFIIITFLKKNKNI